MISRPDIKYFLYVGSDMGVINPKHRIEEYIIEGMDLIFYYRLGLLKPIKEFPWIKFAGPFDVMADSYIAKYGL